MQWFSIALLEPVRERLDGAGLAVHQDLRLYAYPSELERLGPIVSTICLPGYAPLRAELWALPVVEGIARQELLVEPEHDGLGILEVRLAGVAVGGELHTSTTPLRHLSWQYESGRTLVAPLDVAGAGEPVVLEGVPVGRVRFALADEAWQVPDWSIPVAETELREGWNELALDASALGGVAVELFDSAGMEVGGPVTFDLTQVGHDPRAYGFHHAPYRIFGIEPGRYAVSVAGGYAPWSSAASSGEFEIEAGAIVPVRCLAVRRDAR